MRWTVFEMRFAGVQAIFAIGFVLPWMLLSGLYVEKNVACLFFCVCCNSLEIMSPSNRVFRHGVQQGV